MFEGVVVGYGCIDAGGYWLGVGVGVGVGVEVQAMSCHKIIYFNGGVNNYYFFLWVFFYWLGMGGR